MALVRIKLADSDRERYSLPEWLEFDLYRPMLSQVKLLRQHVGMSWAELQAGAKAYDLEALGAVYWLAVRSAGHDVSWEQFEADLAGVETKAGDEDPNSLAPDGAKPTSTPSRRTSRTTTGSNRRTSKR